MDNDAGRRAKEFVVQWAYDQEGKSLGFWEVVAVCHDGKRGFTGVCGDRKRCDAYAEEENARLAKKRLKSRVRKLEEAVKQLKKKSK